MEDNSFQTARQIVSRAIETHTNLCSNFMSWSRAAMALASLGEPGRDLFHSLAAIDPRYRRIDSDRAFSYALLHTRSVTLGSLVYMAREAGLSVDGGRPCGSLCAPIRLRPQVASGNPSFVDTAVIDRLCGYHHSLLPFIAARFGLYEAVEVMKLYRVGGLSLRCLDTVFPQIDIDGRCRTAKIMRYDPETGRRDRQSGAAWLHRYLRLEHFVLSQCLFGEHLLRRFPEAVVCLVESEKSALVCTLGDRLTRQRGLRRRIWLATGGKGGFTPARLGVLRGRRTVIFADADATDSWREALRAMPADLTSGWSLSAWAATQPDGSHADIADLTLEALR